MCGSYPNSSAYISCLNFFPRYSIAFLTFSKYYAYMVFVCNMKSRFVRFLLGIVLAILRFFWHQTSSPLSSSSPSTLHQNSEKLFLNLAGLNRIWIVVALFRLAWHRTQFPFGAWLPRELCTCVVRILVQFWWDSESSSHQI